MFKRQIPPDLRRSSRRCRPALEQFERRLLLSDDEYVIAWDTRYDHEINHRNLAYYSGTTYNLANLAPGDQFRVTASLATGARPPGPTSMQVLVGGQVVLSFNGKGSATVPFTTSGTSETIEAQIRNFDNVAAGGDDTAHVKIEVRQRSNLAALAPTIDLDKKVVTYGYEIRSPVSPDWQRQNVEVALGYAYVEAGKVKFRRIEGSALQTRPGLSKTFEISTAKLTAPPPGTFELRTWIDRDGKVLETDEADNQAGLTLPNFAVDAPKLELGESASTQYRVKGGSAAFVGGDQKARVEYFYASGTTADKIIGSALPGGAALPVSTLGSTKLGVDLTAPPTGATHLLVVADRLNAVPESDELDNVKALALPDLSVTSVAWDDNGGARVVVNIANAASIPAGADLSLRLYWATGAEATDAAPGLSASLGSASLLRGGRLLDGPVSITIRPDRVAPPTTRQIINYGQTIDYLLAVVDMKLTTAKTKAEESGIVEMAKTIVESRETNNVGKLKLPRVSLELFDAPGAATPKERVALWLKKYANEIKVAATQFRIDPRAVAGVIAWEAYQSTNGIRTVEDYLSLSNSLIPKRGANSPGKLHFDPDTLAGTLKGEVHPLVTEEVEGLGLMPRQSSPAARREALEKPGSGIKTSIQYIAAIMGAYADAFEQIHPAVPIRNDPGVLATFYNGVDAWPNLTTVFDKLPALSPDYKPRPHEAPKRGEKPFAGYWVQQNLAFLTEIMGRPRPATAVAYAPLEIKLPAGNPYQPIPLASLLGPGATEVVGLTMRPELGSAEIREDYFGPILGKYLFITPTPNTSGEIPVHFSVRVGGKVVYGGKVVLPDDPIQPPSLAALSTDPSAVRLDWSNGSLAREYRIERQAAGQTWQRVASVGGNQRSWTGADHQADTEYEYRILMVSPRGRESSPSDPVRVRTPRGTTDAPTRLQVVGITPNSVSIRWDEVLGEDHYEVEVSTDAGGSWRLQENVPADHAFGATLSVLPSHSYRFRVVAVNRYGRSAPSNSVDVETPVGIPEAPTNLISDNVRARQLDLHWRDRSGNESEFRVAISRDGINWVNHGTTSANDTGYRVTGLEPGTRYWLKVRAANVAGLSVYSNTVEIVTDIEPPAVPANLRADNVWARTIDLRWDDRSGNESGYRVDISRDGGLTWENVGVLGADITVLRVENLNPATRYLFKGRAFNSAGYSDFSNTLDIQTRDEPPAAPANLRAANVWAKTIDLNWDDRSGNESEFRVAISRDGGLTWDNVGVVGVNATSLRVEGLKANTRYLFRVRSVNATGFSDYSNTLDIRTRA